MICPNRAKLTEPAGYFAEVAQKPLTCHRLFLQGFTCDPGNGQHFVQISQNCRVPARETYSTYRLQITVEYRYWRLTLATELTGLSDTGSTRLSGYTYLGYTKTRTV